MDIWIIRDGEKTGPFHDFEIRRKIETGELPASTSAWHQGLDAWKPLAEIDIFTREFELPREPESDPEPVARTTPPPLPIQTYYLRRFWARGLDLSIYSALWWFGMWIARQDISAVMVDPWVMFLHYVPWFVIETLIIHRFGATPGKWLLGLSVKNLDESRLEVSASLSRSVRILFIGIGFGWFPLSVFCEILSLFIARRLGSPLWDHLGGHRVDAAPLNPLRILVFVAIFAASSSLQTAIVLPAYFKLNPKELESFPPEFKDGFFWRLPDRSKKSI